MKFKLDENPGSRTAVLSGGRGHYVETVSQERLNGVCDEILLKACVSKGMSDHAGPGFRRHPALYRTPGIAVLRPAPPESLSVLSELARGVLTALQNATAGSP
jgi:hypothetical protein